MATIVFSLSAPATVPDAVAGQLPSKAECSFTLNMFHPGISEGAGPSDSVYETLDLIKALVNLDKAIPLGEANLGPAPARAMRGYAYGVELVFIRDCNNAQALGHKMAEYLRETHSFPVMIDEIPGPLPPNPRSYRLDCDSRYWTCAK